MILRTLRRAARYLSTMLTPLDFSDEPTIADLRHADFMIGFFTGISALLFLLVLIIAFAWRPLTC